MARDLPKVVLLDQGAFTVELAVKEIAVPHLWESHRDTSPDEVQERLQGAAVAITNGVALPAHVLEKLPELRLISACSSGVDHIDVTCCERQGIAVRMVPSYAAHTVAEHVFCLLLALRRNLLAYHADVVAGYWQASGQFSPARHSLGELFGLHMGIIGGGAIGQAVAKIAKGFGMSVAFAGRKNRRPDDDPAATGKLPFEEVIRTSDILSIHCPLTEETEHLIGAAELAAMKAHALLINTARGGIVDEQALVAAIMTKQIGGAGFDVAATEPPAEDNPLLPLVGHPQFLLTPHVAWASAEAQQSLLDQAIANVETFLREHPPAAG
ncbi:MAG: NAD(P)-dependent oxidoreductase [Pseudomonadota bacterium]